MKKVEVEIPDNCYLVLENDCYVIKEESPRPKSWKEFCKNYLIKKGEAFIFHTSYIKETSESVGGIRDINTDRNLCTSKEEAESFLALMQLRQLRKAWVRDWEPSGNCYYAIIFSVETGLKIGEYSSTYRALSFPTLEMVEDFLNCFKDLCETAKILL